MNDTLEQRASLYLRTLLERERLAGAGVAVP